METKRAYREELDLADKVRDKMRSDARALKEKLPYVKVEQIDEEIRKLEYRLSHTTLAIQEEKRLISQIASLRKSSECIKDYDKRMDQITQDESSRSKSIEELKEQDRVLNDLKAQQEEQRRILADIREKEASQARDIPALLHEKDAAIEKIRSLRDEIKQLKADFLAKEDEYWQREREWKAQQNFERKLKAEKIQAERKQRDEFRRQKALENFVEPYTDEIILCDQLMSFLQKHAPSADDMQAVSSLKAEIVAPKGFGDVIVSKKNRSDDDLEGWFGGFGGGKAKGKKTKAAAPAKSKEKEKLSLSLDVLTSFQKVKVPPPTTHGDVLKSLDELKEKKESFLDLQKKAREAREKEDDGDSVATSSADADAVSPQAEEQVPAEQEDVVTNEYIPEASEDGLHLEVLEPAGENSPCAQVLEGEVEDSAAHIVDTAPDVTEIEATEGYETEEASTGNAVPVIEDNEETIE